MATGSESMKPQQKLLLDGLESFYKDKILCDVTLESGNVSLEAHKCVLGASSPYFRAMFTFDPGDSSKVELHSVSGSVLVDLVQYFYTGDIHLTEDNVQSLITAADMMQISPLRDRCEDFMMSALCTENCLEVYNFAAFQNLGRLKTFAEIHFLSHFHQVVGLDAFLKVGIEDLSRVLSSDDLNVSTEEAVYEAIIRWIKYDLPNRQSHLTTLFFSMRLPLMDIDFIQEKILVEPLIQDTQFCLELVEEVCIAEKEEGGFSSSITQFNLKPRLGMYYKNMLVFSGGCHEVAERAFCCFDVETRKNYYAIKHHPTFDFKNKIDLYKLIVTENNDIYFLGGVSFDDYHYASAGTPARSSVLVFNQSFRTWEERTPMVVPKCAFGVCAYSNQIFVFGGYSMYPNHEPHKDVSVYDIESDEWTERRDMIVPVAYHAVTVYQNKAFVFGGTDSDNQSLNTVFQYIFSCDQWTLLELRIPKPLTEASAIVHQNKIYVLGGSNAAGNILSLLIYDPEKKKWRFGQEFPDDRKFTSITKGDDCIYVCGGLRQFISHGRQSRTTDIKDLYQYDIPNDQWYKKSRLVEQGSNYTCVYANVNTKYLKSTESCI